MTVQELINELQKYDPKLPVMLSGYEGGVYDGPHSLRTIQVALNVYQEWYYGPHDMIYGKEDEYKDKQIITAVYIV